MPPFKQFTGPSFNFSPEAVRVLWGAGHGQKIAIVDASYPIPNGEGVKEGFYGGSSADALRALITCMPLETVKRGDHHTEPVIEVVCMAPDPPAETCDALEVFREVAKEFPGIDIQSVPRLGEHATEGRDGWYAQASDPSQTVYLRTVGRLGYECALLTVGHSQS